MEILIKTPGIIKFGKYYFKCLIGKNGITFNKKEGDLKTPKGTFNLRYVMYRADKIKKPKTKLPIFKIKKKHICCDNIEDSNYNKIFETNNFDLGERLWRNDSIYDILIVIGYNHLPVIKGKGSAIFLHLSEKTKNSTEGCIAVRKKIMFNILKYDVRKIKIT
ncbi:MAG: hypothetical protein CFH26_00428 [Alphaproteobacteria bacterium MarineAlpha6_Bin4]|nr:MAG: hypothetical protein CFH26_00428 [Alphaproteobacteria bacterium MarineAlpha6_Bin4]|tara:strand:- start:8995 stop:9483 length:489 start_codon:yes stop_codon:yes gene_type:complete